MSNEAGMIGGSQVRAGIQALEVLQTAMQIERDGYAFYAAAARETKDSNAVKMFLSLARDEMEHLGRLETAYCALTKGRQWPRAQQSAGRVHGVFPAPEQAASAVTPGTREVAALKQGIQAEADSIAFYRQAAGDAKDPEAQAMYEYLIREEERHLSILQAEHDYLTETGFWFNYQEFSLEVRD
jgi:rubrerythrin